MTAVAEKPQLISSRKDPRFEVTLYKYAGVKDSYKLSTYLEHGGYDAAKKAVTTMKPGEVVEEVKRSGLRGRGGAGFPTGLKWSFMPKPDGRQRFLVCNADESEPGSFKDRYLLEDDPHQLIEGLMIGCYAIEATIGVIYLRGEYYTAYEHLQQAVIDAREAGYIGKNVFGSGFDFDVILHRGAGAYICGEETALMNSFEGLRANPRLKPPFPAQAGVYGLPTTINNVESLVNAVHIIGKGAEWYSAMGTDDSKGIKLFQISGPIARPGVYELPIGATFRELLYDLGGGPTEEIKALVPGGSSAPMLPFNDDTLDTPMDYGSVSKKGSMLGTGGVILIPKEKCMVDAMYNVTRFYAHESCGKCTPCREGVSTWLPKMFKKLLSGYGEPGDLELIEGMLQNMRGTAFCLLADSCVMPVQSSIKHFRDEYEYLIEHGHSRYQKSNWWAE